MCLLLGDSEKDLDCHVVGRVIIGGLSPYCGHVVKLIFYKWMQNKGFHT